MPRQRQHLPVHVTLRSFGWLLAALLLVPSGAFAEVGEVCSELTLNTTIRRTETPVPQTRDCYRATVPSRGLLTLDVSAPWTPDAEPQLVFLGRDSSNRRRGYRLVRETPRGVIVEVKAPGTFVVEIVSEDPRQPLSGYKLRSAFVRGGAPSAAVRKDVDEEECDILEINSPTSGASLMEFCVTAGLDGGTEPYRLGRRFTPCELGEVDDHGDTPLCATPMVLESSTAGEIGNDAGDDEDFFTFALEQRRSVEIGILGGDTSQLTLYDGDVRKMDAGTRCGDSSWVVRTLEPGRYYVRVRGVGGAYGLRVGLVGAPV
ncbi:MAG: hypothetical protein GY856_32005 [bacterium]|nr:hypothetical protein [bacterium]